MGLGRRAFLKLISAALAGLVIDPLKAVAVNDNVYVNKKLGILFHKPNDWKFLSIKDFGKIKSEQLLEDVLGMLIEEVWEDLSDPICIATKYDQNDPKYWGIFSPTITLNITPKKDLEDLGIMTFEEMLEQSLEGVEMILKDFEIVKVYEPFEICDCKFYEFDAEYLFNHVDLNEAVKVDLKVFKAEHNGFYYDFNCHQSKSKNQIADLEFETFKNSIRLI